MGRRLALTAAVPAALALATAAGLAANAATAGRPQANSYLLCGVWAPGTDRMSGASVQDHPAGSAVSGGEEYRYDKDRCENHYSSNAFSTSGQVTTFNWTVNHSNVNVDTERGTEHGIVTLASTGTLQAGFNGQITNDDFTTPLGTGQPDTDSSSRSIYYASGHAYDDSGSGSGAGNFNTHGGASTGDHFRGTYGTIVYQDNQKNADGSSNPNYQDSPCQQGSANYCFEGILIGYTN